MRARVAKYHPRTTFHTASEEEFSEVRSSKVECEVAARAIVTTVVTFTSERPVEHLCRLLRPGYPSGCSGPRLRRKEVDHE